MPSPEPVRYFDRYAGRVETEAIYGEPWLRWSYQTAAGRLGLALAGRRAWLAMLYGWLMDRPSSRDRILPFIRRYGLDPAEFEKRPGDFTSFNDFFARELRAGARPVDPGESSLVFPADGRHLGVSNIATMDGLFVKGQRLDPARLLGDASLAERYRTGALVLSRLCPVDYHRFHFPAAGVPGPARSIPGPLDSVNPIALRQRIAILLENRRMRTLLETDRFGTVAIVEIGAACVGRIEQTYRPGQPVAKGAEKGLFRFGGSAIATLFEAGRVRLAEDLLAQSAAGLELYAHVGDVMASGL